MQILHISANHWVCASNVFSPPGVCDIFDSMPATYSSTLIRQVAAMMKTPNPSFTLRYINVQMQAGASDCGLFATAFTTALCARQDLHKWCLYLREIGTQGAYFGGCVFIWHRPAERMRRCAATLSWWSRNWHSDGTMMASGGRLAKKADVCYCHHV